MQIQHRGSTFTTPVSGDCGHHGHVGLVPYGPSRAYKTQLHHPTCDFVPPDQIVIVSLNGFRRRVATRHSTQTVPRIDKIAQINATQISPLVQNCFYHRFL
jgi:hypothetical protein